MGEKKIEPLIDSIELGKIIGLGRSAIIDARKKSGLPYYKIGGKIMFRLSEVETWIQQRKCK